MHLNISLHKRLPFPSAGKLLREDKRWVKCRIRAGVKKIINQKLNKIVNKNSA